MASPVRYSIGYSFSSFQANNPSRPLPAPNLDMELANIATSVESLRSSVTDIRRSDGKLANSIVSYDSLAPEIRYLFDNGAVDNATLLAAAVTDAEAAATAAEAAQAAAEAAQAIVEGLIDPAPLFAGAIVPETSIAAATTTDIGAAATARVVINSAATITSFGTTPNRLRFVRFNGASTLTHHATTLILPMGRSHVTAAGDQGIYLSDAAGNWRELAYTRASGLLFANPLYFVEHFPSVLGNGTTDDMAGLQGIIDLAAAAGGGRVILTGGRSYRLVSTTSVTDRGLIGKPGVTLDWNGATTNLECTGDVYSIRPQTNSHFCGPGTVAVTVSSGSGSQSIWHAPFGLGAALGEVPDVGALGNYINATRWSIRGLKITSVRADGYKIAGIGGMSHGVIEDIEFPSDATSVGCVNFDWGTVGNINSADIPASRIVFDAGTGYTVHPNNIDIRRLKIGNMSNAASQPIRLSGVHAIRIDGWEIAACSSYGVYHTAGDLGYEFADSDNQRRRHSGIVIKNGLIQFATTGGAIYCDMYADNVALAVAGGYVPRLGVINPTDIIFENVRSIGNLASNAGDGIVARYMSGGTFRNCVLIGHQRGIFIDSEARHVRIEGGEINSCYKEGIYIGAGTVPEEITVDGVWCWSNGVGGVYAGINAFNGKFHRITRCRLGANSGGDSFQDIGIDVGSACSGVEVTSNHVLAASNVAYKMAATGFYGTIALFTGNTVESAVATPYGGVEIICIERTNSLGGRYRRFLMTRSVAATTPSSGTWVAGDTIEFSDPISGGNAGTKCVASGSPGTWKNYGAIAA
jgi:hypothetical protein